MSRSSYMPGLDGIRALAIIPVVLIHLGNFFAKEWEEKIVGGFLGVDLFFVLSAFLISSILMTEYEKRGTILLRKFYMRRVLRLFPAIFTLVIVHALYAYFTHLNWELEKASLTSIIFYYSNFKIAYGLHFPLGMGHMWSLAVEEQFYLIWPFILLLTGPLRRRPRLFIAMLLTAILAVALWRAWLWSNRPGDWYWFVLYLRTDTRFDTLLIGTLFAFLAMSPKSSLRWHPILGLLAFIVLLVCMRFLRAESAFLYMGGMTLIAFASGALIFTVATLNTWWTGIFHNQIARGIGQVSYGMYIWHMPIFAATARYTESLPLAARVGIAMTLLVTVTLISWFCIEKPFLRMKSQFTSTPS